MIGARTHIPASPDQRTQDGVPGDTQLRLSPEPRDRAKQGRDGCKKELNFLFRCSVDLQKILVLDTELNSVCGSNKNHDVLHKRWCDS